MATRRGLRTHRLQPLQRTDLAHAVDRQQALQLLAGQEPPHLLRGIAPLILRSVARRACVRAGRVRV